MHRVLDKSGLISPAGDLKVDVSPRLQLVQSKRGRDLEREKRVGGGEKKEKSPCDCLT